MSIRIFKSGEKSSFEKKSRSMAKVLALGASSLAIVFCLFIFFYFPSDSIIRTLSVILPVVYYATYLISLSKIKNKELYKIIFFVFIFSSLIILYIAYRFAFNSEYIILMLVIYNIILFALPTPQQVLIYFGVIFIPLEFTLLMSDLSLGFSSLITVSFSYVFVLSYVIAQQKRNINQRSHQNAEILKTLVNNTHDSIFLVDSFSRKIWDANDKSVEVFGWDDSTEFLSKEYYKIFSDEQFIPTHRNEITQNIAQNGYYQSEALFKRKNGSEFWGSILLSPFKAINNNFYLVQIKNIDIKKKFDDRLLANNEKFSFILNNLEEFIYLFSYKGKNKNFEYISPYIEQLFGLTKSEYLSSELRNKLNERYHPDDLPKINLLKKELMKHKEKVSTTYRMKPLGKNQYISLHETVIPRLDENGEIDQVLGIIREIS